MAFRVVSSIGRRSRRSYSFSLERMGLAQLLLMPPLGLDLRDLAERQQPVSERRQRGDVVGGDRRHDTKAERENPRDTGEVRGEDQLPAPADVPVEVAGDVPEVAELGQAFLHE